MFAGLRLFFFGREMQTDRAIIFFRGGNLSNALLLPQAFGQDFLILHHLRNRSDALTQQR